MVAVVQAAMKSCLSFERDLLVWKAVPVYIFTYTAPW